MARNPRVTEKTQLHRLPKRKKEKLRRRAGLGSPLGRGLPKISPVDWVHRQEIWNHNRRVLESQFTGIFTSELFSKLPLLGGRNEGVVRELIIDKHNPFISYSGMRWKKLAIKKFNKGARSSPEEQARTLHSLHLISQFWIERGKWPIQVKVPEAITYKYPFFVMRSLTGEGYIRADKLPAHLRIEVFNSINQIGKLITLSEKRLINQFKEAGLQYPSPDFIPSNIITKLDKNERIETIWIIDQFSIPGSSTGEKTSQHGGIKRMGDRARWFPELT